MKTNITQEKKFTKRIGYITLFNADLLSSLRNEIPDLFNLKKISLKERFSILKNTPGLIESRFIFENITPTVGFEVLTKLLTGNLASLAEGQINVHALGSGATAPDLTDTALETEVFRKAIASLSYNDNKAYYTAVYEAAEANGTHTEMGLFIDGDAGVADSGTLWDRSAIAITKTAAQSLTIDYEDTFIND